MTTPAVAAAATTLPTPATFASLAMRAAALPTAPMPLPSSTALVSAHAVVMLPAPVLAGVGEALASIALAAPKAAVPVETTAAPDPEATTAVRGRHVACIPPRGARLPSPWRSFRPAPAILGLV